MNVTIFSKEQFKQYISQNTVTTYSFYQTKAGELKIFSTDLGIFNAEFINNKNNKSNKNNKNKEDLNQPISCQFKQNIDLTKFILIGTKFQINVWQEVLKIPDGQTRSYQEIAQSIGQPKSFRAVANALADNKIAYFIPCHKVIRKNKNLGGYKWGIEKKLALLQI